MYVHISMAIYIFPWPKPSFTLTPAFQSIQRSAWFHLGRNALRSKQQASESYTVEFYSLAVHPHFGRWLATNGNHAFYQREPQPKSHEVSSVIAQREEFLWPTLYLSGLSDEEHVLQRTITAPRNSGKNLSSIHRENIHNLNTKRGVPPLAGYRQS